MEGIVILIKGQFGPPLAHSLCLRPHNDTARSPLPDGKPPRWTSKPLRLRASHCWLESSSRERSIMAAQNEQDAAYAK